ncbi:MAG: hypothetical protein ABEJ92_02625 [Halobacteriales archaeon]
MRRVERLGWALVGGLAFLVLLQGYELAASARVGWLVKGVVSLGVAAVTVVLVPLVERRLAPNGSA